MHLRPHAVSAGSVACRVVDSPVGTLDARSCHALDSHGSPHNAAVPGLEVSRGDVLQHQLIQAQLCYQPLQLRVLLLQILQPPGLVHPQTAILFTPPELGLLHDSRFLTRLWRRLSVRHGYFDLPQKGHYLFRTMLLASRHLPLLLFQFVSTPLAQIEPGTPAGPVHYYHRSSRSHGGHRPHALLHPHHPERARPYGALMCVGVATANSILVVSFAKEKVVEHGDAVKAALEAGTTRFRPVIMTALAMIIGMVPMALGLGDGGEQNAPLGRAVIGGLLCATVATLVFVPSVFALFHK